MVRRGNIDFTREEAVVLYDAYIELARSTTSFSDKDPAVQDLSAVFRGLGIHAGADADYRFRSAKGIAGRLRTIHRIHQGEPTAQSLQLLNEIVSTFRADRVGLRAAAKKVLDRKGKLSLSRVELAALVAEEANCDRDQVMLLRHSSSNIKKLIEAGGTIEDYTFVQPTESKYDYLHPDKIAVASVAVIVEDRLYAVYRVNGLVREGTSYSLASPGHRRFDEARNRKEVPAKLFDMEPIQVSFLNRPVIGWESRTRTTTQRSDGSFFCEILVEADTASAWRHVLDGDLAEAIDRSLVDDPRSRARRLATAPRFPARRQTQSYEFVRNPDVIAEVLIRASGYCEHCEKKAPFIRKSDDTPYLEVHHRVRLADGGEDTVENAIALCPNCHREMHYG